MNILLISEFFPTGKDLRFSGGVEARTYFVAKNLAKNHKVSVICIREPNTKAREILNGIRIIRVGSQIPYNAGSGKNINPLSILRFIKQAINEGAKSDAQIVDGGNFIAHFIARQIGAKKKIPVVYWYPDVFIGKWIKTSGLISGISGYIVEKLNLSRGADYFIAISKTTKDKLIKNGVSSKKVDVVYCGIDKDEFKNKISKSPNPKIITVSRLVHYKRIRDLVIAFALVSKKIPKAHLEIIGRGPERKSLDDLIRNLKLERRITFKSDLKRYELLEEIKSSTIFCMPSETEGFGISIIEAAASGVPYVVSNIEVFKEVTKNGLGGLLFQTGDIKELAAKIEKLLNDAKLYDQKQKEAIKLAKIYDWQKISVQTEQLYKSLINK